MAKFLTYFMFYGIKIYHPFFCDIYIDYSPVFWIIKPLNQILSN